MLGANGAGKSTLLHLLAGLARPSSGSVDVLGRAASSSGSAHRRRVGVALDRPAHIEALTVAENARLFARAAGLAPRAARAATDPLLERFGLEPRVPVAECSLGMKRKLLLVQALAHEPEVILLDEPTLGLDPAGVDTLGELLAERAAAGAALLAATNDVRAAPLLGTRVVFLLEGRKLADEPTDALLARLRSRTRIEVTLAADGVGAPELLAAAATDPPPLELTPGDDVMIFDSTAGAEPLPDLLRWLLRQGADVRDVRVREPDLADVFRQVPTGGRR